MDNVQLSNWIALKKDEKDLYNFTDCRTGNHHLLLMLTSSDLYQEYSV